MSTPAFLTGSYRYGIPRPASSTMPSDIDIVILCDNAVSEAIKPRVADDSPPASDYIDRHTKVTLPSGIVLDLILTNHREIYDAWKAGTEQLEAEKPVRRDRAKAVLKPLCDAAAKSVLDAIQGRKERQPS